MAEFAQTAINKITQIYEQWLPKLPAEVNPRNVLIFCVLALLCIGSIMVASASMPYAERINGNAFHYMTRHTISIGAGAAVAYATYKIPLNRWFNSTFFLWFVTILLLLAVLLVGTEVNGSKRWIRLAGFTLQASEVAKVMMAIFTADYVVRRAEEVRNKISGLGRLSIIMGATILLVMLEPDLGATVVITLTMLECSSLAGAPWNQFGLAFGVIIGALIAAIAFEPYRLQRFLSFSNPWEDPLGTGYQLSNALMAFGRGEWTVSAWDTVFRKCLTCLKPIPILCWQFWVRNSVFWALRSF